MALAAPLALLLVALPALAEPGSTAASGSTAAPAASSPKVSNTSLWATFTARSQQNAAHSPGAALPYQPMASPTSLAGMGQSTLPRCSVAVTRLPTRISMAMTTAATPLATLPAVRHTPVASLPPASPGAQVYTIAMTSTPMQSVPHDLPGATVTHPASGTARPADIKHAENALFAQLENDLNHSQSVLNKADQQISEGQRQLGRWGGLLRQAMLEAGPDATGLHPFVRVAQRYAGTPYVWGGESRYGFDCSGFIMVVMRDLGYRALPHSAAEQFTYGKPIAQELLKPGDLVFFKNTYKKGISHVGIYLGKRRFIHAAGTGKGTIVSSLDDPQRQAHYAGARRLIPARS